MRFWVMWGLHSNLTHYKIKNKNSSDQELPNSTVWLVLSPIKIKIKMKGLILFKEIKHLNTTKTSNTF